jgi:hypothetical protein
VRPEGPKYQKETPKRGRTGKYTLHYPPDKGTRPRGPKNLRLSVNVMRSNKPTTT